MSETMERSGPQMARVGACALSASLLPFAVGPLDPESRFLQGLGLMTFVHQCGAAGGFAPSTAFRIALAGNVTQSLLRDESEVAGGLEAAAAYWTAVKLVEAQGWWTWAVLCGR